MITAEFAPMIDSEGLIGRLISSSHFTVLLFYTNRSKLNIFHCKLLEDKELASRDINSIERVGKICTIPSPISNPYTQSDPTSN